VQKSRAANRVNQLVAQPLPRRGEYFSRIGRRCFAAPPLRINRRERSEIMLPDNERSGPPHLLLRQPVRKVPNVPRQKRRTDRLAINAVAIRLGLGRMPSV